MIHTLFEKLSKMTYTLRFSILSIFILLFLLTTVLLIVITSYRFEQTLTYTSKELMDRITLLVLKEAETVFAPSEQQSMFTVHLIQENDINLKNNVIVNYSYHLVELWPYVDALHFGNEEGSFIITEIGENNAITTLMQEVSNPNLLVFHWDKMGNIIKKELLPRLNYDPRTRPWYIKAKVEKKPTWTNIYAYERNQSIAVTYANPLFKNGILIGVLGLDIKLNTLVEFIKTQKVTPNGFSFIVTTNGEMIAFPKSISNKLLPKITEVGMPWLTKSLEIYNKNHLQNFSFIYDRVTYFASYRPLSKFSNNDWLIGVIIPKADFTERLEKLHIISIIICLTMLIIGIAILYALVSRITNPIKKLVKETEKIKQLDLTGDIRIASRIKEVILLTTAMQAMKKGLSSFQKYVPKTLVKQLIETEEDTHIGGVRKPLVILFSDIKDFTYIAETLDPNDLMIQMCQYFEELTQIIIQSQGTIDKYIGDSIMAFWGALIVDEDPTLGAATAAILCQRRLNTLNTQWQTLRKPPLYTRMGIHMGEAIIGNLGSSERLNYTAVGDAINMASRLENINKLYGTRIIVSDTVYSYIKDRFYLRFIDRVAVRGRREANDIYELLEEDLSLIPFDLKVYQKIFEQGFEAYQNKKWEDAIHYFTECLKIHPADTVTPLLIARCRFFQKEPPPSDWDGIWRISQ